LWVTLTLMPVGVLFDWLEDEIERRRCVAMIGRCIDNLFQADVLVEGTEYEVRAERDDCYVLSGFDKGYSTTRFEIVKRCAAEPGSSR
jgi:hypothetical protein